MRDDFKDLAGTLGFELDEDDEAAVARARQKLADYRKMFVSAGLDEEQALTEALALLQGFVKAGSGQGGMHPNDFADLVDRAFNRQGLERLVLEVRRSVDGYHLEMTVLATDAGDADKLKQVATKLRTGVVEN